MNFSFFKKIFPADQVQVSGKQVVGFVLDKGFLGHEGTVGLRNLGTSANVFKNEQLDLQSESDRAK